MRPSDPMIWTVAAHAGLAVALGARVMLMRNAKGIPVGDGDDREMRRAMRAYGNFAEWVPLTLLVLLAADLRGAGPLLVGGLGTALLLGRVAHGYAIGRSTGPSMARTVGVALTLIVLCTAAVTALVS